MGCTMLGDEYFSRVYHDWFLAWYAQRAWSRRGLCPTVHCQKSILFHKRDGHCLEDTGVTGTQRRRGFSPDLPHATKLRPNKGEILSLQFLSTRDLQQPQVDFIDLRQLQCCRSRVARRRRQRRHCRRSRFRRPAAAAGRKQWLCFYKWTKR